MSPADKIAKFSEHKNLPRFFCQKEEDLPFLFHKMLEGLWSTIVFVHRFGSYSGRDEMLHPGNVGAHWSFPFACSP